MASFLRMKERYGRSKRPVKLERLLKYCLNEQNLKGLYPDITKDFQSRLELWVGRGTRCMEHSINVSRQPDDSVLVNLTFRISPPK
jgi:hypothetical protein